MSDALIIEFDVTGLLAECSEEYIDLFKCTKTRWIPRLRKKQEYQSLVGWHDAKDGRIAVGLGAIKHLAKLGKIVPKFNYPQGSLLPPDQLIEYVEQPFKVSVNWRDVQTKAIQEACSSNLGNIVAPMAAGKTAIILALAQMASADSNVLVLAPTVVTIDNLLAAAKEYRMTNVHYSKALRSKPIGVTGQIIVSIGQDIAKHNEELADRNPELWRSISTVIADESHKWHKMNWMDTIRALPLATRCYSFSATSISPREAKASINRMNYKNAYAVSGSGPVILRSTVSDVSDYIDLPDIVNLNYEWLAKDSPVVPTPERDSKGKLKRHSKPWSEHLEILDKNEHRSLVIEHVLRALSAAGRITVYPINNKGQGLELQRRLNDSLTYCWFGDNEVWRTDGTRGTPEEVRVNARAGLTIIATPHLDEGWNLPAVNVVLFTESKEPVAIVQRSGRAIRKSAVKPLLINLCDTYGVFARQSALRSNALRDYYKVTPIIAASLKELKQILNRAQDV